MPIKLTKPQKRALKNLAKGDYCFNLATFHAKPYLNLVKLGLAEVKTLPNTDQLGGLASITEAGQKLAAGLCYDG
jgi:hypothetical protein